MVKKAKSIWESLIVGYNWWLKQGFPVDIPINQASDLFSILGSRRVDQPEWQVIAGHGRSQVAQPPATTLAKRIPVV